MPERDVTVTAVYQYKVTVVDGTASKEFALPEDTVTITANDHTKEHLVFEKWTADVNIPEYTKATTTFTMPAKAVTITANYQNEPMYEYTVVNGTPASGKAYAGEIVTITANDRTAENLQFYKWRSDDNIIFYETAATITTFVMPAEPVNVIATYTNIGQYSITVIGGTANKKEAFKGETITVTANMPPEGMKFDKWTGDDVSFEEPTEMVTTFVMPAKDVTLTSNYVKTGGSNTQNIELRPGWNLVALQGDLSFEILNATDRRRNTRRILPLNNAWFIEELKPFILDTQSRSYRQASLPLAAGTPLWIFSETQRSICLEFDNLKTVIGSLTEDAGWHLIGVGGSEPVELVHVLSVWKWNGKKWSPLETNKGKISLEAGLGYLVEMEERTSDGIPDSWKLYHFKTNDVKANDDADGDGLNNLEEYRNETDPFKLDSDGDEMTHGWEVQNKKNPLNPNDIDPEMITARYLVVDLSGGQDAESYPVRYSSTGPDLNDDTCRTTELWLRRIPMGAFIMGSPEDELGRNDDETQHEVILTQDYYIGVFECTQKQWELVMGNNPSSSIGDCRPVEQVVFSMIRGWKSTEGGGWPKYGYSVDTDSFMGKLRTRTGLTFDLPTEAQWEYACRAGTTTALNSGKKLLMEENDSNLSEVGRYGDNRKDGKGGFSQHTTVGSYLPNAWGLYDMHGNVYEWCLDWYGNYGTETVDNPVGKEYSFNHVLRSSGFNSPAFDCRSANRNSFGNNNSYRNGFRVHCHLNLVKTIDGMSNIKHANSGDIIHVTANVAEEGMEFDKWLSDDVEFSDATAMKTTFVMPSHDVTVTATYIPKQNNEDALYMVVDLSGGADAEKYPVRYTNTAPDLSSDTCRTTELWLRKIPGGTFIMGSPLDEPGRNSDEIKHEVTLTEDFFIGVFECTQRQWELIMSSSPSLNKGKCRPVESVSYEIIRGTCEHNGAGWPQFGHSVDSTSFMGKLQMKTGLIFDLPTEAQWEYACRAGTTTSLNSGKNLTNWSGYDDAANEVGRYYPNQSDGKGGYRYEHTTVGSYLSNSWGLYDMHGNVHEWCLDWYDDYATEPINDPVGAISGTKRVKRGGSWLWYSMGRSAWRSSCIPSYDNDDTGFRVLCIPNQYPIAIENGKADFNIAHQGDTITITANEPDYGWLFNGWTSNVELADKSQMTTTFTMSNKPAKVTAEYIIDSKADYVHVVNGSSNFDVAYEGDLVTIIADSSEYGMLFERWISQVELGDNTSETTTFTMPAKGEGGNGILITAKYIPDPNAIDVDTALYAVVDLSGGPNAKKYPVRYTNAAPNLSDDTCRTTELWLRRIPSGTFIMGSPSDEVGLYTSNDESQHEVTLTQDFFIGIFECTQNQWELVMGSNCSQYEGDYRPVENVSFNMIRGMTYTGGAGWPTYGHTVESESFMGKLQSKTGLVFDLPTEAQWEYACRAGTTTALNSGKNLTQPIGNDPDLNKLGRYVSNKNDGKGGYTSGHTKVGSYQPNSWGLYDMHGNVREWCLDWYGFYRTEIENPVGKETGEERVYRGGCWDDNSRNCRSARRFHWNPSGHSSYTGFRIVLLP
ncbi:MAG: formylglycine-generating enzyme family protein [Victivallales bacterium]|nr:formylglycine-generating enzyme family protein [Victivallales bacterium]